MLEIKAFDTERGLAFDIANFKSYMDDLKQNPVRLDADYLVFEYAVQEEKIGIENIWIRKVWELAGHSGANPLKLQVKRGDPYNIRPVTWYSDRATYSPFENKEEFLSKIQDTADEYTDEGKYKNWKHVVKERYENNTENKINF